MRTIFATLGLPQSVDHRPILVDPNIEHKSVFTSGLSRIQTRHLHISAQRILDTNVIFVHIDIFGLFTPIVSDEELGMTSVLCPFVVDSPHLSFGAGELAPFFHLGCPKGEHDGDE
jgi:hypothetical protein